MFTKGKLIKALRAKGIRATHSGKRLSHTKLSEIIALYYDTFGGVYKEA